MRLSLTLLAIGPIDEFQIWILIWVLTTLMRLKADNDLTVTCFKLRWLCCFIEWLLCPRELYAHHEMKEVFPTKRSRVSTYQESTTIHSNRILYFPKLQKKWANNNWILAFSTYLVALSDRNRKIHEIASTLSCLIGVRVRISVGSATYSSSK